MATERAGYPGEEGRDNRVFLALLALTLVGFLFAWSVSGVQGTKSFSGSSRQKYPGRKPVVFWHMWTANWKDTVEDICARFNESQTEYEVIPLSVPGQASDSKFLLAVAGGDPPDCMAQWNPVIPKWAESKLLVPLDRFMTPDEWADFRKTAYPVAQKIGMYRGNLYGVTTGLNIWACYARIDALKAAGLLPGSGADGGPFPDEIATEADLRRFQKAFPDTLERLVEWGRKLHVYDDNGNLTRMGFMPQWFAMYAPAFGGGFYDWQTGRVLLNTPENLRALTCLADCRKELGFDKVVRFESSLTTTFGADWPFVSGRYAIVVDGQWRVEQLKKYAPDLKYGTAPIPPPAGGCTNAGWSNGNFMIVPVGAKQPQGAWEFIKFWAGLSDPERAAEFYTWGGWLPLNDRIANAAIYRKYVAEHPQFQTFLDILPSPNISPTPPVPYQVYLFDRIQRADDSAMRGTLTPQEALDRLAREMDEELARRKEYEHGR